MNKSEEKSSLEMMSDEEIVKAYRGVDLGEFCSNMAKKDAAAGYLLNEDWMRRGNAMLFVSSTGAGKSSLVMQMAIAWAAGWPCFDIRPVSPLKIGIYQTENDEFDMSDYVNSMIAGHEVFSEGWHSEISERARMNIVLLPSGSNITGNNFARYLQAQQNVHNFDLIIIDPLLAVLDGDMSDNENMTRFVRHEIDPFLKSESGKNCALLFVHHTTKQSALPPNMMKSAELYAEYFGAGASELPNWVRASLAIMKVPGKPTCRRLIGGKRSDRLDWKFLGEKDNKPAKELRYHDIELDGHPEIKFYWHDTAFDPEKLKKQNETKESIEETCRRLASTYVRRYFVPTIPMSLTEYRKYIKDNCKEKGYNKHIGEQVYNYIVSNTKELGVEIVPGAKPAQKFLKLLDAEKTKSTPEN